MRRSAVRELLRASRRPGVISLAGGLPAPELFPCEAVAGAVGRLMAGGGGDSLQYGETEGNPDLRDWIAARYARPGRPVSRENVMVTTGSQQALDLIGRVLLDEGAEAVVENPAYLALLSAWRPLGVRLRPVAVDDEGLRVDELACAAAAARLIYTVPDFQNPTGVTLSLERRKRLVAAVRETGAGVGVVEDGPYGWLRYDGGPLPSLFELDGAVGDGFWHVLSVGSFSKVLAPGLRVGWVVAPEEVIDRLVRAKQAIDLHTGSLDQAVVVELLRDGVLDAGLPRLRAAYRERRDTLLAALAREFPSGATWTRPEGGMFVWVRLPAMMDAGRLLSRALEEGVAFVPGGEFHVEGGGDNTLRLNFTHATPERLREGVARLARVVGEGACSRRLEASAAWP